MRMSELLPDKQKELLQKKAEKLSAHDLKELMGVNRDTYTRTNRTVRRNEKGLIR